MITVATLAVLMVPARVAVHNPVFLGALLGTLCFLGAIVAFLVVPLADVRGEAAENRLSSKSPPSTEARNSSGEAEKV
jgi:hypothetical protein